MSRAVNGRAVGRERDLRAVEATGQLWAVQSGRHVKSGSCNMPLCTSGGRGQNDGTASPCEAALLWCGEGPLRLAGAGLSVWGPSWLVQGALDVAVPFNGTRGWRAARAWSSTAASLVGSDGVLTTRAGVGQADEVKPQQSAAR